MSYTVEIDESACAAHRDCVEIAPEVFILEDVARVVGDGPDELIIAAAEACPSTAIRIVDLESAQLVYP